jgi:LmbE family N-acetylglucosaminyl deacetylase
MTRSLLRTLLLKAAGQRMRQNLRAFVKASSIHGLSVSVCEPGKSKVAVLAPHMDDEVLGCGGTIARHVAAGSDVMVIFLTDGRHGGAGIPQEIVGVRKAEARGAAQILGIRTLIFLDAEDSRLRSDRLVADRLREILERERPDIVYLPFFLEGHLDHRAANDVLLAATRGSALSFECRGYEVWTPLFPNCMISIDETIHLKRQALSCYQSQLAVTDYLHSCIGLNAYRAMALGSRSSRFAEAFHTLELADYRRLYGAVGRLP